MFRRILIIGHSNIGDVCYDLIVVGQLRENFPQAKISFLTSHREYDIARCCSGVDKIFLLDALRGARGLARQLKLIGLLRKENFDVAVVLKRSLMHLFLGIPCSWSLTSATRSVSLKSQQHSADRYLELLRAKGIKLHEAAVTFAISDEDNAFADNFLRHKGITADVLLVGILPIAAWSLKSWPIARWNALAAILKNRYGACVIAFGKSSDDPFSRAVLQQISPGIISALDKTSLRQAMALMKRCRLFIAPDSSLLHVASCMGIETIGLYGATSPDCFYPYFHRQNVIVSKAKLECLPCCPGRGEIVCNKEFEPAPCMEAISVEELDSAIRKILKL